jgi:hypothetical protein
MYEKYECKDDKTNELVCFHYTSNLFEVKIKSNQSRYTP